MQRNAQMITPEDVEEEILKIAHSPGKLENTDVKTVETTVFHKTEEFLNKYCELRYNTISVDIEVKYKNSNKWISVNENQMFVDLRKNGIKVSMSDLLSILKSDFVPDFNPLTSYFDQLPIWNKSDDYIDQFASYLKLSPGEDSTQFLYHFRKWCVRVVKCATIEGYFNKQAFIITDDGKGQNIGKSSWCRYLCPSSLNKYIAEDFSNNDKDSRILICKNFLINMDELAVLSKKEINQLKSLFSKDQINERLPYDKKNTIIPRVASFIGSTNKSTFLQDETGSVRWLCFVVEDINWKYRKEFNIDNLWSQALSLAKDPTFIEIMTPNDILQNEGRNKKFQDRTVESDLILKVFEFAEDSDGGEFKNATEVMVEIQKRFPNIRLNRIAVGKALTSEGFKRTKVNGKAGYLVKTKFE